jgi:NAD(P)-dependent dehydrogenase (short-subunit alcohol dehydrogenase family)
VRNGDDVTAFKAECLAGQHILVTGASSGIGQATAQCLARHGARLSLIARDPARLERTKAGLPGTDHYAMVADLSGADACATAVRDVAVTRGPLSGIFYSAGSTLVLPVRLLRDKHLNNVFGAGLYGAFGAVRAAATKGVLSDGGSIVLMSSIAAKHGRPALSAYCAAKAGVDALVRCAALELASRRIRVNSVCAAAVETPLHDDYLSSLSEDAKRKYHEAHPLGFGKAGSVADAALFLFSESSTWISGINWPVDGAAGAG